MKRVVIGSTNKVKIEAAQQAFTAMFPEEIFEFIGIEAPSDVAAQPWGKEETLRGAWNRVAHAQDTHPGADFYVAIESGLKQIDSHRVDVLNAITITDGTKKNDNFAATFRLPDEVGKLVLSGMELDPAFRTVFGDDAHKQGKGGVGHLSNNLVPRTELYRHAMVLCLAPFFHADLYK